MTSPDPDTTTRHFIELATRPLEDAPEIREEARGELLGRLAHADEAELEPALGRMAKVVPRHRRGVAAACWALWLVLAGIAGWQTWRAVHEWTGLNFSGKPDLGRLAAHLDAEQREFVSARFQASPGEVLSSLEHLKNRHPDDPRFYEDYASKYMGDLKKAPPDYRETWQRLDPDNGIWPLYEAGHKALDAQTGKTTWDEASETEAMELFAEAGRAKRFTWHLPGLQQQRAALLAEPQDIGEQLRFVRFAITQTWLERYQPNIALGKVVARHAEHLASAKDPERLRALISCWERVGAAMAESSQTSMSLLMLSNFLKPSARALELAAHDLGMAEQEAELQRKQLLFSKVTASPRGGGNYQLRSYFAGMLGTRDELDPATFEPGRRMEYAMLDRGTGVTAAILLLLVMAGVIFEAYRRGRRVNGMAEGLALLLQPVDGLWCLGLGLLLPLSYYLAVTRLTPLGCRDWGAFNGFSFSTRPWEWLLAPAFIQPAAGLLLVLCCLVQATRWRIARRMGFLGLGRQPRWLLWLVPLVAALLLPMSGIARWLTPKDPQYRFLIASAAATGLPLLWLLWQAVVGLGSGKERALGGVLLSRNLILPLGLLTALLLGSWLPLKQQEHEWFLKDEFIHSDRSHGGLTKGEVLNVEKLVEQYREAFGSSKF